jgi:hypothetical protein
MAAARRRRGCALRRRACREMSRAFAVCKGGPERGGEIFPFRCSRHVMLAVSPTCVLQKRLTDVSGCPCGCGCELFCIDAIALTLGMRQRWPSDKRLRLPRTEFFAARPPISPSSGDVSTDTHCGQAHISSQPMLHVPPAKGGQERMGQGKTL